MWMDEKVFIDLFAGSGGLSEGFLMNGFTPVAHIEKNNDSSDTLKTRAAFHYLKETGDIELYNEYLRGKINFDKLLSKVPKEILDTIINAEITEESLPSLFKKVDENLALAGHKEVDLIVGGPPCQAYSLIGRARDKYRMKDDPRNYMYRFYADFLRKYKPKVFIFENVMGLLSAGEGKLFLDVQNYFRKVGYDLVYKVLNARDYGVLQNRKRVILIGWSTGSHLKYPAMKPTTGTYVVNDLLIDLPPLRAGESPENVDYATKPTEYLKRYRIRSKDEILTQHITRPHNERDLEIYRRAIILWNREKGRLNYTDLPQEFRTHKNIDSFLDRYKVVAGDLAYSQTIVSHISKDGHYYIHPDIFQLRSLSVREAARLQSFPDNYYFEGSRTSAFAQIGNAVPPLLAESLAKSVGNMLKE